jgi:hypothetical protein
MKLELLLKNEISLLLIVILVSIFLPWDIAFGVDEGPGTVHFIYLIPSDQIENSTYTAAMQTVATDVQEFYSRQLGNQTTFAYQLEVIESTHNSDWFLTPNGGDPDYYLAQNSWDDLEALTLYSRTDPADSYVIFVDAPDNTNVFGVAIGGAGSFATVLSGTVSTGASRLVGSSVYQTTAHEMGHTFGLDHDPFDNSVMWGGTNFGTTYFNTSDLISLRANAFFQEVSLFNSSGLNFSATASNDASVGTLDWVVSDGTLASSISSNDGDTDPRCNGCRVSGATSESSIRLFVGGSAVGNDNSPDTSISTGLRTYGSPSDLWGITPTPSQVNASDFGVGLSISGNGGTSKYLYASNFGFDIPAAATVYAIEVSVDYINPSGTVYVDYIQMKVYYSEEEITPGKASVQTGIIKVNGGKLVF